MQQYFNLWLFVIIAIILVLLVVGTGGYNGFVAFYLGIGLLVLGVVGSLLFRLIGFEKTMIIGVMLLLIVLILLIARIVLVAVLGI